MFITVLYIQLNGITSIKLYLLVLNAPLFMMDITHKRCDDEYTRVCLSVVWLLSGPGSVSGWTDSGRVGEEWTGPGHNTLLSAVSSLTLHFLPNHTLTGTAAITARRLQEHNIWLISLTN